MNDSNINIGISLDRNTKAKLQAELDKIKGLNVNVQADTSSITSSVQKAINDALKNIKVGEIKLPQVSSQSTASIDKFVTTVTKARSTINSLLINELLTGFKKNVGRPEMYGLKIYQMF